MKMDTVYCILAFTDSYQDYEKLMKTFDFNNVMFKYVLTTRIYNNTLILCKNMKIYILNRDYRNFHIIIPNKHARNITNLYCKDDEHTLLKHAINIHTLHMYMSNIQTLECIAHLKHVTHLTLNRIRLLTSLQGIEKLKLTTLIIIQSSAHDIPYMPTLKTLSLQHNNITTLSSITNFNLTTLQLIRCDNLMSLMTLPQTLVSLNINYCPSITSLEPIFDILTLTSLTIIKCCRTQSLSNISKLKNLTLLTLEGFLSIDTLTFLQDNKKLEILTIDNFINLTSLCGIEHLDINDLELNDCRELQRIDVMCCSVTRLAIKSCNKLKYITALKSASRLRKLTIDTCQNLVSISELKFCTNLFELQIFSCRVLSHFNSIGSLSLHTFELAHCDNIESIQLLFDMPSLKNISISHCKKIKQDDIVRLKRKITGYDINGVD